MKIYRPDQRSPEWKKLRRGIPTASWFHTIITPLGKPTDNRERKKYLYRLVAERLLQHTMPDSYVSPWMERGIDLEDTAARAFAERQGVALEPGGFVTTDDGTAGCSPDRLITNGRKQEAVEIKVLAPWTHIGCICEGPCDGSGIAGRYKAQVQGQLLIGKFEAVHFWSWNPKLPAVYKETLPDEKFQKSLSALLDLFKEELDQTEDYVRRQGSVVPFSSDLEELDSHFPWREP